MTGTEHQGFHITPYYRRLPQNFYPHSMIRAVKYASVHMPSQIPREADAVKAATLKTFFIPFPDIVKSDPFLFVPAVLSRKKSFVKVVLRRKVSLMPTGPEFQNKSSKLVTIHIVLYSLCALSLQLAGLFEQLVGYSAIIIPVYAVKVNDIPGVVFVIPHPVPFHPVGAIHLCGKFVCQEGSFRGHAHANGQGQ